MRKWIAREDCIKGHVYKCRMRDCAELAVFDGEYGFIGIKEKHGDQYLFCEYYYPPPPGGIGFSARPYEDTGISADLPLKMYLDDNNKTALFDFLLAINNPTEATVETALEYWRERVPRDSMVTYISDTAETLKVAINGRPEDISRPNVQVSVPRQGSHDRREWISTTRLIETIRNNEELTVSKKLLEQGLESMRAQEEKLVSLGMSPAEIDNLMNPARSFYQGIKEEILAYEDRNKNS